MFFLLQKCFKKNTKKKKKAKLLKKKKVYDKLYVKAFKYLIRNL